ncbi:hypothetical protein HMI54_012611 [Coelomomyces lativittatus]|nr:hypothetical protein HMI56_006756 [Coelomomyces lativittatus]KAJ1515270.1 hypothetical protein HMI54_012611 [Coelomomyces lativittatus]KAJ1516551.1 hypothetical protein HMI55_001972 [Coelomomyces lativittatus]
MNNLSPPLEPSKSTFPNNLPLSPTLNACFNFTDEEITIPFHEKENENEATIEKAVEKEESPLVPNVWKVVVRHLPPTLPATTFWDTVADWLPETLYTHYVPGHLSKKSRTKPSQLGRAYLTFPTETLVRSFHATFHGHVFRDSKGSSFPITVALALNPIIPNQLSPKLRHQAWINTIEKDKTYLHFIKSLSTNESNHQIPVSTSNQESTTPSMTSSSSATEVSASMAASSTTHSSADTASTSHENLDALTPGKTSNKPSTTPLLDYLKTKAKYSLSKKKRSSTKTPPSSSPLNKKAAATTTTTTTSSSSSSTSLPSSTSSNFLQSEPVNQIMNPSKKEALPQSSTSPVTKKKSTLEEQYSVPREFLNQTRPMFMPSSRSKGTIQPSLSSTFSENKNGLKPFSSATSTRAAPNLNNQTIKTTSLDSPSSSTRRTPTKFTTVPSTPSSTVSLRPRSPRSPFKKDTNPLPDLDDTIMEKSRLSPTASVPHKNHNCVHRHSKLVSHSTSNISSKSNQSPSSQSRPSQPLHRSKPRPQGQSRRSTHHHDDHAENEIYQRSSSFQGADLSNAKRKKHEKRNTASGSSTSTSSSGSSLKSKFVQDLSMYM